VRIHETPRAWLPLLGERAGVRADFKSDFIGLRHLRSRHPAV
jgi:hypothetical protein